MIQGLVRAGNVSRGRDRSVASNALTFVTVQVDVAASPASSPVTAQEENIWKEGPNGGATSFAHASDELR